MPPTIWIYNDHRNSWECQNCWLNWVFTNDGPKENEVEYCPKCGRKISEFKREGEGE